MSVRFFSEDSFWNTPIAEGAEIDAKSNEMLQLLEKESQEGDRGFWVSLDLWTVPIYEVDEETPLVQVQNARWPFRQGDCFENPVPFPLHAVPDHSADAHIAFVDLKKRKAWDLFHVFCEEGQWKSLTGMTYSLDQDGVFDPDGLNILDRDSAHFYGPSRAAAVPAIAGMIMYDEVVEGKINHKLSFATCANAFKQFVYPARWTDGTIVGAGMPEGCVIQLDPELDLAQFDLSPAALTIARALQEYGAVNVDVCGGKTIYAEGLYSHPTKSWKGLLEESDLTKIGMSNYRILKLENITHKGDDRKNRATK